MRLEELQKKNPKYNIKDIYSQAFQTYGRIVNEDVDEAISYVSANVHPPQSGNCYMPSVEALENLPSIRSLSHSVYGHLDVIAGIVFGDNNVLNGIEYHQGSETIIAVTDFVLIVGHIWDMKEQTYDSSLCECFYVPQGTVVECYGTTLHYTPVSVNKNGFRTICLLLKGTGDSLPERQGILKKKNKWFVAHKENLEKIESGDYPGLKGELIMIHHCDES